MKSSGRCEARAPAGGWNIIAERGTELGGGGMILLGQPLHDARPPEEGATPIPLEPVHAAPPGAVMHRLAEGARPIAEPPAEFGGGQPLVRCDGGVGQGVPLALLSRLTVDDDEADGVPWAALDHPSPAIL